MTCGTCHRRLPKPKPPKSGLAIFWREVFTAAAFTLPWGPPWSPRVRKALQTMEPARITVGGTGQHETLAAWTGARATEAAA